MSRFASHIFLVPFILLSIQSCQPNNTLKQAYIPPVAADSSGPSFRDNVSQIKYWDRIASANRATSFAWWDSTGAVHEMNEYYNKVIVLNFFGTWSQASVDQLREIAKVRLQPDTNVVFLGVTQREKVLGGKAVIALDSFVKTYHIDYPVMIGSRDFGFCYGGIDVVPTTFLITRQRYISDQIEGYIAADALKAAIAKAEGRN